jgi:hypothetical protein
VLCPVTDCVFGFDALALEAKRNDLHGVTRPPSRLERASSESIFNTQQIKTSVTSFVQVLTYFDVIHICLRLSSNAEAGVSCRRDSPTLDFSPHPPRLTAAPQQLAPNSIERDRLDAPRGAIARASRHTRRCPSSGFVPPAGHLQMFIPV